MAEIRPAGSSFVSGDFTPGSDPSVPRVALQVNAATLTWPDARLDVTPHGAAECSIALREGGRWHDLMAADDPRPHWTTIATIAGVVPRGALLPRAAAWRSPRTAVAGGPAALRAAHAWRPVPAWVSDRDAFLVRDVAEALLDHAGAELMRIVSHEDTPGAVPPGVRRLAYLTGVHDGTMSSGFTDSPPDWWPRAADAWADLGRPDVAALLRRLDPDAPGCGITAGMDSEYLHLTFTGEWHGDDALRTALRHRVGRPPHDYGVDDPPPLPAAAYEDLLPTGTAAFIRELAALAAP